MVPVVAMVVAMVLNIAVKVVDMCWHLINESGPVPGKNLDRVRITSSVFVVTKYLSPS